MANCCCVSNKGLKICSHNSATTSNAFINCIWLWTSWFSWYCSELRGAICILATFGIRGLRSFIDNLHLLAPRQIQQNLLLEAIVIQRNLTEIALQLGLTTWDAKYDFPFFIPQLHDIIPENCLYEYFARHIKRLQHGPPRQRFTYYLCWSRKISGPYRWPKNGVSFSYIIEALRRKCILVLFLLK